MAYMPDEQILRILGQNERYQITPDGIIIDMASANDQGQPTLIANIRDVRELEYNVAAEEAPGNMAKRMLELTALMEMMQAGFPVDPTQVIEKMEISESEKKRWLDYINQQQAAQAQQAQEEAQFAKELEMKKLALQEQDMQMDFMVDIAKLNQMAQKDEKKMQQVIMQMDQTQRQNLAQFVTNVISTLNDEESQKRELVKDAAELEMKQKEHAMDIASKAAEVAMNIDAKEAEQGIAMASKESDLKFTKAKNKENLDYQKKKNQIALELQRRKGEQSNDGDGGRKSAKEKPKG
jgi:hypothetical protein